MSHWTRGKTKIKDSDLLRDVAMDMGLSIVDKKQHESEWAGTIDCEFLITDNQGGELAVIKDQQGDYSIQMDNYHNSICDIVGESAALLTRDYQTAIHKREAQLLGGVIANEEVDAQGYVYLEVSV